MLFGTGATSSAYPTSLDLSGAPTQVNPGIVRRFRELAQIIKNQKSIYTEKDGLDLGIVAIKPGFDPSAGTPDVKVTLVEGGHPQLKYTRGDYDGILINKDSGDGKGFVFLDKTTNIRYIDNSALPAAGGGSGAAANSGLRSASGPG